MYVLGEASMYIDDSCTILAIFFKKRKGFLRRTLSGTDVTRVPQVPYQTKWGHIALKSEEKCYSGKP